MNPFAEVTDLDELNTAAADANTAADAFRERIERGDTLTAEELAELQGHFDRRDAARARIGEVEAEVAATATAQAEAAARFETPVEPEAPGEPGAEVAEPEADPVEVPAEMEPALAASLTRLAEAIEGGGLVASATSGTTARPRVPRPVVPQSERALADLQYAITAAGETHGFAIGQDLSLDDVGTALIRKLQSFPTPKGDGKREDLRFAPVATITMQHPEELQVTDGKDEQEVFKFALDETRLKSEQGEGSLIAAGGWCAPSEQLYDLCVTGESLDGMVSTPEVQAKRGGIKYTSGPDFATLYSAIGFHQTEAQAIAGTSKGCYEVPCPSFTEARLEVEGVCIKVPILTQAAYPELVNRIISGSLVVHAHKMNAFKLSKIEAASTAKTATDLGTVTETTLRALELRMAYAREAYRMSFGETLEVKLPHWVRGVIKSDLRLRMGNDPVNTITDATVDAWFASVGAHPEFVYDWAGLGASAGGATGGMAYPSTFKALMYPAGTFLALTNDIINLSSVYDAASLDTNVYTGVFSEEGIQIAKMCAFSEVITMPNCSGGRVGVNDITCS